jgi:glycosyltransferase involved in cell wall biosynthesis
MTTEKRDINIPLVTICIQTYQHAPYIRQTIESVLSQKTDFPIEINLGEDGSTDGTREICMEYAKSHPNIINLFLNDRKNVIYINGHPTGRWNIINNFKNSKGKYIALLPGDDYWTDPYKLQKQVDFLEDNNDFSMCFHDALIVENDTLTEKKFLPPLNKSVFVTEDTLYPFSSFAPASSILFRNNLLTPIPNCFYFCAFGDRILFTMISKHGKIKYLDFTGSVRRMHPGGVSNNFTLRSNISNRMIFFKKMPSYIGKEYQPLCDRYLKYYYELLIEYYRRVEPRDIITVSSTLKSIRYLLSPTYLRLLKVKSIKEDKGFKLLANRIINDIKSKLSFSVKVWLKRV